MISETWYYWSYEGEWRVVSFGKHGYRNFDRSSRRGITFGARTSEEHERQIRQAASMAGLTMDHRSAQFHPELFRLELVNA